MIVRAWARHTIALACLTLAAALALAPQLNGLILTAFAVVALLVYGAAAFLRAARGANGITRRRPQTVAAPTVARCW